MILNTCNYFTINNSDKQRSNYTDQYNSVAYTPCDTPNQYDNLG